MLTFWWVSKVNDAIARRHAWLLERKSICYFVSSSNVPTCKHLGRWWISELLWNCTYVYEYDMFFAFVSTSRHLINVVARSMLQSRTFFRWNKVVYVLYRYSLVSTSTCYIFRSQICNWYSGKRITCILI